MPKYHKYDPDYSKLYPGVEISEEVMAVLKKTDRKMEYMEVDLKRERFRQDQIARVAEFIPSREDSYERMQESYGVEFEASTLSPEDAIIHKEELRRLQKALVGLEAEELDLARALFLDQQTEREYACQIGLSQKGVNKRWHRLRAKLKKFLEV